MEIEKQLIPHFPPPFSHENANACDFGICGVIAVASGGCVHFSYLENKSIIRAYSVVLSNNIITALKFHPRERYIAVGDKKGSIVLFNIDNRSTIASYSSKEENPVYALEWNQNILMVLHANKNFSGFTYSESSVHPNSKSHDFFEVWKVQLPEEYTKMLIDPIFNQYILFSGFNSSFCIFYIRSVSDDPKIFLRQVTINGAKNIVEAKWSLHLPYYTFLLLESELFLFNINTQGITSVTPHQQSQSSFRFLLQFPSDHRKLYAFHQSGTISVFHISDPFNLDFQREIIFTQKCQEFVNFCVSPIDESFLILWFVPLGLAFFDISLNKIISLCSLFIRKIVAFSTDEISLVYSTDKGEIVCSDLFDIRRTQIFKATNQPILFVSICTALNQVFWHSSDQIGLIDLASRTVKYLSNKATKIIKARGSFQGGFIVQRSQNILGLFINNKEKILLLNSNIIDFCFNENNASVESGQFCVLLDVNEIVVYNYENEKGIIPYQRFKNIFIGNVLHTNLFWYDLKIIAGTQEGDVIVFNLKEKKMITQNISKVGIKRIHMLNDGFIMGINGNNHLFVGLKNMFLVKSKILQFYPFSKNLILILSANGYLHFICGNDFSSLSLKSNLFHIPTKEYFISQKLLEPNKNHYFSKDARDAWLLLNKKIPLRQIELSTVDDNKLSFEKIQLYLIDNSSLSEPQKRPLMFSLYLYSNNFEEAAKILNTVQTYESSFLSDVILSALISGVVENINEKQMMTLKMAALSLFASKRFEDGAMLLKLARLDRIAVDYLFENDQISLAMKFIGNMENKEEKKELLLRFGGYLMKHGQIHESIPFFASCGEFHSLLYALYSMREIADCFFIKRYAEKNGLLQPLNGNIAKSIGNIMGLEELCHIIDAEFKASMSSANFDLSKLCDI